jgi:hypothetical protein
MSLNCLSTKKLTDDTVDVTSEPDEQDLSMSSSSSLTQTKSQLQSHNPFKIGQMEVELGGSVTLHCPQGESLLFV